MTNNQQPGDMCWYCKKNPADPKFAAGIPMYNVTNTQSKSYGSVRVSKTNYQRISVAVPRCEQCQKRQRVINTITRWTQGIISLVGVIMLVTAGAMAFNFVGLELGSNVRFDRAGIIAIIGLIVTILGWNTRTILNVVLSSSPLKPEFYGSTSPNVQKLLKDYWKVGKAPM